MRNVTNTKDVLAELSADDVRALRDGDSWSFSTHDGLSTVRAYLRPSPDGIITVREQRLFNQKHDVLGWRFRDIRVLGYRAEDFDGPGTGEITAYADVSFRSGEWLTIANHIRPGESLFFYWVRGNNNVNLSDAGLVRDELRMQVGKQSESKSRTYLVAVQVGPDNTARMVKRVRK